MFLVFLLHPIYLLIFWKTGNVHCINSPADTTFPTLMCEIGWYSFGNYCYKAQGSAESTRATWSEASNFCKESGAHLVSIHSKEEMEFITNTFLPYTRTFTWIGLHDQKEESTYEWSDGSTTDYVNWRPGEPTGVAYGEEDCAGMLSDFHNKNRHGKWNDAPCWNPHAYICKRDKMYSTPVPAYLHEKEYLNEEKSGQSGCASVTTVVIIVSCAVLFMMLVAGFMYFKRDFLSGKAQNLGGAMFRSHEPESCSIDRKGPSDKYMLLEK